MLLWVGSLLLVVLEVFPCHTGAAVIKVYTLPENDVKASTPPEYDVKASTLPQNVTKPVTPPEFSEKPNWPDRTYYDEDGPPIELACRLKSTTDVTILWYKDAAVIVNNPQSYDLEDRNMTLTLPDPKKGQTGAYKCLAYNSAGNISYTGNILITDRQQETRPRVTDITPSSSVVHASLSEMVNISCTFDVGGSEEALMDLTMDWLKNKSSVDDTNHTVWGLDTTETNNQIFSLTINKLQREDYGEYVCYGENQQGNVSKSISILPPDPEQKSVPLAVIIGASVGGVCVITIFIVAMVIYRSRRQNKYEQLEWPDPDNKFDVPKRQLEYDVFISYSSEDLQWVKDVLFYDLDQAGYNVCIDFKDFVPGMPIADNIMDAIYKSKKTIVLMSKNFLKSMWGQFELQQAHNRAILQRKDCLILIKHDESKVPVKLMGRTFLDWSDPNVQPHFWTRLHEAIGTPGDLKDPDVTSVTDTGENTVVGGVADETVNQGGVTAETVGQEGGVTVETVKEGVTDENANQNKIFFPEGGVTDKNDIPVRATDQNTLVGGVTDQNALVGGVTDQNALVGGVTDQNALVGGVTDQNALVGGVTDQNTLVGRVTDKEINQSIILPENGIVDENNFGFDITLEDLVTLRNENIEEEEINNNEPALNYVNANNGYVYDENIRNRLITNGELNFVQEIV